MRGAALAEAAGSSFSWRTRAQLEKLRSASRGAGDAFSFAVVGDAEPGRFIWSRLLFGRDGVFPRLLDRVRGEEVDFVIQLGDMVSRGLPEHYAAFFRDLGAHCPDRPYLTVLGNHDRRSPHGKSDSVLYRSYFGRPNYWFDHGPVRFVVLDTADAKLRRSQLRWLALVLDTDKTKVVLTHMPPAGLKTWTVGGLGGFREGSREFMDLMSRKGVDRVYMGHVHGFGCEEEGGVTYVLTGGGGSPLYPSLVKDRFHHYLVVRAAPSGIREIVQKADGERFAVERPAPIRRAPLRRLKHAFALALLLAVHLP